MSRCGSSAVPFAKCDTIHNLYLTSQQAEGIQIFCYLQGIELCQDQVPRPLVCSHEGAIEHMEK